MAMLKIAARGQVTSRASAAQKTGSIERFIGALAGKSKVKLAVADIKKAAGRGWARER